MWDSLTVNQMEMKDQQEEWGFTHFQKVHSGGELRSECMPGFEYHYHLIIIEY